MGKNKPSHWKVMGSNIGGIIYITAALILIVGEFNACARRTPNGYICFFDTGLRKLLFNMPHAITYWIRDENLEQNKVPNWSLKNPLVAETIAYMIKLCITQIMKAQIDDLRAWTRNGQIRLADTPLEDKPAAEGQRTVEI